MALRQVVWELVDDQIALLQSLLSENPLRREVLEAVADLGLPDHWVATLVLHRTGER